MVKRVVRKRMTAQARLNSVQHSVEKLAAIHLNGSSLASDVARDLGLANSTYLLNLLKWLWMNGRIDMYVNRATNGGVVYHWKPCYCMHQEPLPFEGIS